VNHDPIAQPEVHGSGLQPAGEITGPCAGCIGCTGAATTVAIHLRELPNTALEAVCDLISVAGTEALVRAIADEIVSRHPRSLRP